MQGLHLIMKAKISKERGGKGESLYRVCAACRHIHGGWLLERCAFYNHIEVMSM